MKKNQTKKADAMQSTKEKIGDEDNRTCTHPVIEMVRAHSKTTREQVDEKNVRSHRKKEENKMDG